MSDIFVHYFFNLNPFFLEHNFFKSNENPTVNRAFLYGDAVQVYFYIQNSRIIMAEECYFFLMASMRKMRMNIPLDYTLEYFENLFHEKVLSQGIQQAVIRFMVYRGESGNLLSKSGISNFFDFIEKNILEITPSITMDLIKEISVNTHLLSNLRVHCPENIYAEIYARENDLDDVILLNPNKRIARSIFGNLLFLEGNTIKIPKTTEGAYISPLMENFVTFIHKNQLAEIQESEIIAFESQKADEILMISDEKGIAPVAKIRNKNFEYQRFSEMLQKWEDSFNS